MTASELFTATSYYSPDSFVMNDLGIRLYLEVFGRTDSSAKVNHKSLDLILCIQTEDHAPKS